MRKEDVHQSTGFAYHNAIEAGTFMLICYTNFSMIFLLNRMEIFAMLSCLIAVYGFEGSDGNRDGWCVSCADEGSEKTIHISQVLRSVLYSDGAT